MGLLSRLLGEDGEDDETETETVDIEAEVIKFPSLTKVEIKYVDGTSETFTYYDVNKRDGVKKYYEPDSLKVNVWANGIIKTRVRTRKFKEVTTSNVKSINLIDEDCTGPEMYETEDSYLDRETAEEKAETYDKSSEITLTIKDDE